MAVRGRTWSAVDKSVQQLFIKLREQGGNQPMPKLANEMGLSYSRFRDLLNGQHGTPTLEEFITICSFFGTDPAEELRAIEDKHDIAPKQHNEVEQKDIQELRDHAARIEKMALHAAEQAAEIRAHPERFTLVAKRGDIEAEQDMYNELP